MKLILLLISMAIVAYLTATYVNSATVTNVPGANGPLKPTEVLEQTRVNANQIEADMAKRAAAPMPPSQ